jgi:hypothetical protein
MAYSLKTATARAFANGERVSNAGMAFAASLALIYVKGSAEGLDVKAITESLDKDVFGPLDLHKGTASIYRRVGRSWGMWVGKTYGIANGTDRNAFYQLILDGTIAEAELQLIADAKARGVTGLNRADQYFSGKAESKAKAEEAKADQAKAEEASKAKEEAKAKAPKALAELIAEAVKASKPSVAELKAAAAMLSKLAEEAEKATVKANPGAKAEAKAEAKAPKAKASKAKAPKAEAIAA